MTWQRVKGHDSLVTGFRRVVQRGRLAHAYLFTGPRGVGKNSFARELAKALLCEGENDFEGCDQCPACKQIEAGTHPDFFAAVRPAEVMEFPIDLMRTLCQSFSLKSARGKGKVVVIDDADDLNAESANCFLKTLEEPPPRSVLILIGSTADRQLPTIVSRCQVVRFAPLSPLLVDEILQQKEVSDPVTRERLVRLSQGSPGTALLLADPALWEFREKFLSQLCAVPPDAVSLGKMWSEFVEDEGKEAASKRARAKLVLRVVIDFLEDALELSLGGTTRRTGSEDQAKLRELASRAGPDVLLEIISRCLDADEQIGWMANLDLVLEAFLDTWAQRMPTRPGKG